MPHATDTAPVPTVDSYCSVRDLTECLAEPLSPEDQTVQSMADVSPTKWHRAHTTWFFETFVLEQHVRGYEPHHPQYRFLFNSYYEAVGPRHTRSERGHITRPGAAEVTAYRRHVDAAMAKVLARDTAPDISALIELGLHHEQQHQELLLMDIKHVLSRNPMLPAYSPTGPHPRRTTETVGWSAVDGGLFDIGHAGGGFSFDNELPRHRTVIEPFAICSALVTCGEWLEFIDDGGYQRPELWLSDGWATVGAEGWDAPLYWTQTDGDWRVYSLAGQARVDPHEPVCHVSYYEANAYARWRGCRLPTEAEWEVAAKTVAAELGDLYGQLWQWTSSAYSPYPGFVPAAGAVGEYNGKFMVNQQVLRGSACVTPGGHSRPTYRNFFPPAARWPFTGVRLVASA